MDNDEDNNMDVEQNSMEENCVSPRLFTNDNTFREDDDSYTVSFRIEKDQIECCICYQAMTGSIYKCRAVNHKNHNVCGECEWRLRRVKQQNGHVKTQKCPLCKTEGEFVRNFPLERQIGDFSQPCPYHAKGCTQRFFMWADEDLKEHCQTCLFKSVKCPVCNCNIDGCAEFVNHLKNGKCAHEFVEVTGRKDKQKQQFAEILTKQHSFVYNSTTNYVILFIWTDEIFFDIHVFSMEGNCTNLNHQCNLDMLKSDDYNAYQLKIENNNDSSMAIQVPTRMSMTLNIKQLSDNPHENLDGGKYFVGRTDEQTLLRVKYSTLEEILSVGCTLDCRDFHGKWYEAEILEVGQESSHSGIATNRGPDHTRILVHYLGYSSNYDEWFDLTADMSRIAMSGTYTIGPNLRTIRRSSYKNNQQNPNNCPQRRVMLLQQQQQQQQQQNNPNLQQMLFAPSIMQIRNNST